jgi:hypothetical protein
MYKGVVKLRATEIRLALDLIVASTLTLARRSFLSDSIHNH